MSFSAFEKELMAALRPTEWKSVLELIREIQQARRNCGVANPHVSIAIMYLELEKIEDEELVEKRHRDLTQEKLDMRGGRRELEWRLTQQGHIIKARQTSSTPEVDTGGLVPKPA